MSGWGVYLQRPWHEAVTSGTLKRSGYLAICTTREAAEAAARLIGEPTHIASMSP